MCILSNIRQENILYDDLLDTKVRFNVFVFLFFMQKAKPGKSMNINYPTTLLSGRCAILDNALNVQLPEILKTCR